MPDYKYPNKDYDPKKKTNDGYGGLLNDPMVEHEWVPLNDSKITGHYQYTGPESREAARRIIHYGDEPYKGINAGDIDLPLSKGNKPDPRISKAMQGLKNAR